MKKLHWKYGTLVFGLLNIILLSSPMILLSRQKPMGAINIFRENAYSERTVKVNGNTAINEQTITSPSVIETPCRGTELTVTLGKAGRIHFGSDTKMNLAFDENKISGVLLRGSIRVSVRPSTTLNVQTKDGFITVFDQNQANDVVIDFAGGTTQARTLSGLAILNGTSIASGQCFIVGEQDVKSVELTNKSTLFTYFIVPIGLVISSILGDTNTSDSNLDSMQINVGPMR